MKRISILAVAALIAAMAVAIAPAKASNIVTVHVSASQHEAKIPVGSTVQFVMDDLDMKNWKCDADVSGDSIYMGWGSTNSIPPHIWYYFEAKKSGKSTVSFTCAPKSKSQMQAKRSIEIEVVK